MDLILDVIFHIVVEVLFGPIYKFLGNDKISKSLRILVALFLFSIPIGLMIFVFLMLAEANTILAFIVSSIGIFIFVYFAIKVIYKICTGFDKNK